MNHLVELKEFDIFLCLNVKNLDFTFTAHVHSFVPKWSFSLTFCSTMELFNDSQKTNISILISFVIIDFQHSFGQKELPVRSLLNLGC